MGGHTRKTAFWELERGPSLEPDHAGSPPSDSQPPELGERKVCCLSPQAILYSVTAAQVDEGNLRFRVSLSFFYMPLLRYKGQRPA